MASIGSQQHSIHRTPTKPQMTAHINGCIVATGVVSDAGPVVRLRPQVPPVVDDRSGPLAPAYVLRLAEHQKELHRFVWQLFDDVIHTDVTITVDDGQYIKAHKLILCAFSSHFRQVLSTISTPYQHPVLMVNDMHYEDVRSLIEFMYRGSITVPNHRLPRLLKCAKQLKIRGLYESNEEIIDENHCNYCPNVSQTVSPNGSDCQIVNEIQRKDILETKSDQKEINNFDKNMNNYNKNVFNDWLKKRSNIPVPNPPKFSSPTLTPMQQKIALDLTKRMDLNGVHNTDQCLPINPMSPTVCTAFRSPHQFLFRSTSVDESQLIKNKMSVINGIDVKTKRAPSSLDGYLDNNNNDLEPEHRKEKKRNLNIFHAAKYRNRKKQQLELLFAEEADLQKRNCIAKVRIEKLESTILALIWQQTKRSFNSQTVFCCPVCGSVQNEVPKLRSHINLLHNDTEALMKFLMLQRTPEFTSCANTAVIKSTNTVQNSTISTPIEDNHNPNQ